MAAGASFRVGRADFPEAPVTGRISLSPSKGGTCLAERGHSCPQQLPNASLGRFVARSPQSQLLRTGMSALNAYAKTTNGVMELWSVGAMLDCRLRGVYFPIAPPLH